MKKRLLSALLAASIALPLAFVLIFFGYFPLQYEIVLHTDNVVGEGICQTYMCPSQGFAAFYELGFYFGSELKKATIGKYHYDVREIQLITSDVSEFDILSVDSYVKGIHLTHFDAADLLNAGETFESDTVSLSLRDDAIHVTVADPNVGATISFEQDFIPAWFRAVYAAALLAFAALLAALLALVLARVPALKLPLLGAACIAVTLLAGCFFCGSLPYVTYRHFLLNWLLLYALSLLLNALTLPFLGTALTMAFTTFWYIANYFVIALRDKPIMPADLKAIGTATEVMGGYTFMPSWKMALGVLAVIGYIVALVLVWRRGRAEAKRGLRARLVRRGALAAVAAALALVGVNTQTFKDLETFAWDVMLLKSFHEEGMVTTYLKSAMNSAVKEPEGYSREIVNGYLEEYRRKAKPREGVRPTNIIMVMNEAFSDLRTVGLDGRIDAMPFIDSLEADTAEGSLYVSVYGGGTCNTEFEALTGNTLAFMGSGAYPYTENVTKPLFSLAQYFRDLGYSTDAFHANSARNWNRNMVYPNLGFEEFHSIEDYAEFGEVPYLHNYPADIADYRYMEAVSAEKADHPRFLFNVTMQNHAGYERWLDVERADTVAEYGADLYEDAQIYLSLVSASDADVRQLVETYRDSDEPTMIVFFGDHQPSLPEPALQEIYVGMRNSLDQFKSKFFIWTNYDTPELHDTGVSANYLSWLILDQGNFPLTPYHRMLEEVYAKYPVITAQGVIGIDGAYYTGIAEIMDDPLIQKYQYIQYANLFDEIDPGWFEVTK